MIWLASFPRSGNTFLRNILFEAYGLESSTYHRESTYPLDQNFLQFPLIKTHELPSTLEDLDTHLPAVYLVRDGRDAVCSLAHHRADLIAPGSDYYQNLKEAIIADRESFFGGWSRNAEEWLSRADLIIRYEDLIDDPLGTVERLRKIYDLPTPDRSKFPTFEDLKYGIPKYGAGRDHDSSENEKQDQAKKFFRRGRSGSWKQDMPNELHDLFWSYHGDTMEKYGYSRCGQLLDINLDFDSVLAEKLDALPAQTPPKTYKVLIESNKLISSDNDGVKRYQVELLKSFLPVVENPAGRWVIDLLIKGNIVPLEDAREYILQDFLQEQTTPKSTIDSSNKPSMEQRLVAMVPRRLVSFLAAHEITAFHTTYESLRAGLFKLAHWFNPGRLGGKTRNHKQHTALPPDPLDTYDLIHIPLKQHFEFFLNARNKMLVTVHDLTHLSFPDYHTKKNIANANKGMEFLAKKNTDVIAISQSTRMDLLDASNLPERKVHLIYEAADRKKFNFKINRDDCHERREKYGLKFGEPYIICLSTLEPRKNLKNTIDSYVLLRQERPDIPLKLVIAGKKGWNVEYLFEAAIDYGEHIFFTGFVDDNDLAYLYSGAVAMSYLSFYEGFGLPPLEAMCCGTPVIYGNNSSLSEVVGQGGLPADPSDITDIKNQFEKIFYDTELRRSKSIAALKQSLSFSWRHTAIQTLALYQNIIDND